MRRSLSTLLTLGAIMAVGAIVMFARLLSEPDLTPAVSVNPLSVCDPVKAAEELPEGFRQLFPRDGIRTVYNPESSRPMASSGSSGPW